MSNRNPTIDVAENARLGYRFQVHLISLDPNSWLMLQDCCSVKEIIVWGVTNRLQVRHGCGNRKFDTQLPHKVCPQGGFNEYLLDWRNTIFDNVGSFISFNAEMVFSLFLQGYK